MPRAGDEPEAVIDQVRAEMQLRGLTQAQVARESGISATSLTQLLGGSYAADPRRMTGKLAQWLAGLRERAAQPRLPEAPDWVATPTGERIIACLGYAQMAGDIAVVYGGAGLGKTSAAREYQRRYSSVWLATMSPATAGVTTALEEVCLAVGISELPGGGARMQRALISRVTDTRGLLIVDEAQHLSVAALDALRALHDATGIGIALLGNEQLYGRMTGGARVQWLDRLHSRIGRRLRVIRPVREDVSMLATAHGVTEAGAIKVLSGIGAQAGALRGVGKTLRLARMMAAARDEEVGRDHLVAAWRDLTGESPLGGDA
jgi:DNA transposition AAA+ family ATPase